MIKSLLKSPIMYEFAQWLWYRSGTPDEYIATYARPRLGERMLDIGCGVGTVSKYFPDVVYHGFDSNDVRQRGAGSAPACSHDSQAQTAVLSAATIVSNNVREVGFHYPPRHDASAVFARHLSVRQVPIAGAHWSGSVGPDLTRRFA